MGPEEEVEDLPKEHQSLPLHLSAAGCIQLTTMILVKLIASGKCIENFRNERPRSRVAVANWIVNEIFG